MNRSPPIFNKIAASTDRARRGALARVRRGSQRMDGHIGIFHRGKDAKGTRSRAASGSANHMDARYR